MTEEEERQHETVFAVNLQDPEEDSDGDLFYSPLSTPVRNTAFVIDNQDSSMLEILQGNDPIPATIISAKPVNIPKTGKSETKPGRSTPSSLPHLKWLPNVAQYTDHPQADVVMALMEQRMKEWEQKVMPHFSLLTSSLSNSKRTTK